MPRQRRLSHQIRLPRTPRPRSALRHELEEGGRHGACRRRESRVHGGTEGAVLVRLDRGEVVVRFKGRAVSHGSLEVLCCGCEVATVCRR